MTHTFQHGDRVVCTKCAGQQRVGANGQYWEGGCLEGAQNMWGIKFDVDSFNIPGKDVDFYSFGWLGEDDPSYFMRHDTELREGDWVRYEKTDEVGTEDWNGKIGVITLVNENCYPTANVNKIANGILQANLVKIQPPKEGAMQERQEDAIERGIKEKIQLLERQVEKAKCCLETYRDLKKFIDQGKGE